MTYNCQAYRATGLAELGLAVGFQSIWMGGWALYYESDTPESSSVCRQAHEAAERFNPGWLEDEGERVVLEAVGARITPLCRQPGRMVLTPSRLYFQPFNVVSNQPTQVFHLDQVPAPIFRFTPPQ